VAITGTRMSMVEKPYLWITTSPESAIFLHTRNACKKDQASGDAATQKQGFSIADEHAPARQQLSHLYPFFEIQVDLGLRHIGIKLLLVGLHQRACQSITSSQFGSCHASKGIHRLCSAIREPPELSSIRIYSK